MTDKEIQSETVERNISRVERKFGADSRFVSAFRVAAAQVENLDDPLKEKIASSLLDYAFFDHREVYTNGVLVVPFQRVVDALMLNGCGPRQAQG